MRYIIKVGCPFNICIENALVIKLGSNEQPASQPPSKTLDSTLPLKFIVESQTPCDLHEIFCLATLHCRLLSAVNTNVVYCATHYHASSN